MANDTTVGLAGYFYANDVKFLRLQKHLMWVCCVNTGAISEAALPFWCWRVWFW